MNEFLGTIRKYKVLRETDLGYVLTFDGTDEFFLHRNETNFQKLTTGQIVDAFLYTDKKSRLALTLIRPSCTVSKLGFARVQDINPSLGAFMNIGTSKDVLLSKDDLPLETADWPQCGDMIVGHLRVKADRLILRPSSKDDILNEHKPTDLPINEKVKAYVYRITKDGVNLITETFNIVFVYYANLRKKYRLGEPVMVKILTKNEDDYTGTLTEPKEILILSDRDTLLEYLKAHQGIIAITEKSSSDAIMHVFKMSKKAFKAALGSLYKDHLIEIHDDKIILL
jgi:hypothetical protein